MSSPIVIAHHLIFTAYGWWLPNDPRGSTSHEIRNHRIAELGELHQGRKTIQPAGWEIRRFYRAAASGVLKHALLKFDDNDVRAIAESFQAVIESETYTCWACVVMPDHVHLLIRKHKHQAEEMIENFQSQSRSRLRAQSLREANHPVWGGPGWKVFLDHPDEVWRTIRYIEDNPLPWKLPRQKWGFVKAYDGWPLHKGHSPNSPYVKRLRAAGRYP